MVSTEVTKDNLVSCVTVEVRDKPSRSSRWSSTAGAIVASPEPTSVQAPGQSFSPCLVYWSPGSADDKVCSRGSIGRGCPPPDTPVLCSCLNAVSTPTVDRPRSSY